MNTGRTGRCVRRIAGPALRCLLHGSHVLALSMSTAVAIAGPAAAEPPPDTATGSTRDFDHARLGRIQMRMPPSWLAYERQDGTGTTFVRIAPPHDRFGLEIQINTRSALKLARLTDAGLPGHLVDSLSGLLPKFMEDTIVPLRFGPRADGVYVRLTDRHPRPGEFLFLTRGLRLDGDAVIVFTLYASDHDASVLSAVLTMVAGIRIAPPG